MLNANVAYLAIPVVIKNNDNTTTVISNTTTIVDPSSDQGDDDPLSPAAIANLLSILSSLGSIVVGLLLSRQHRTKARESALDAVRPVWKLRTSPLLIRLCAVRQTTFQIGHTR